MRSVPGHEENSHGFAVVYSTMILLAAVSLLLYGLAKPRISRAVSGSDESANLGAVSFPGTNTGLIPDSLGSCGNPSPDSLDVEFNVTGIPRDFVSVQIQALVSHPWVGDLSAVLIAPDGTEHILFGNTGGTASLPCGDGSALSGTYTFTDIAAGTNWWTAAAENVNEIPPGLYRTTVPGPLASQTDAPVTSLNAMFDSIPNVNGTWVLRFNDAASDDTGMVESAQITIASAVVPIDAPFDFDGDGKTDVSIFRPNPSEFAETMDPEGASSAQWWFIRSGDDSARGLAFGMPTDIPVPGDYTGDGKTDVAFFKPASGEWFVLRSEDDSFYAFPFGASGDVPAQGDFDGDGKTDAAVFRPATSDWYIFRSSDSGITVVNFGIAEDLPTIADFDGDGLDDIAVFRPSVQEWWQFRSTEGPVGFSFGSPEDKVVVGDWTGDGKADLAFFRPSNSFWFVLRSEDYSYFAFPWGTAGDLPAPGDYDGDGVWDAAIWRESDATWYISGSTSGFEAVQFGASGDRPLSNFRVIP